ncbi:anti-sigma factor domain-containing protein [Thermotalea metallivorans]|uniref:Anti-sigma-I factor RsgI n=1 Tax=Thermotalea metallivorans TaxID=520762 RepID=A0A140L508_9FIRM|nr:anti-sigma factor domain-containing protein [Thermotalea metallivorans]KXG75633.1 Anti-sigma-I factor RsgI [Thermotalea metallivorans]
MVYRGCVIKIENDFALVLTNTMEYLKIVKKDGLVVGKEIIFVTGDLYKENKISVRRMGLAAAVVFFMVFSMTWMHPWIFSRIFASTAVIVSIDINPSVELEINRDEKVLKAIPVNVDGQKVISKELVGMAVDDAVLRIVNNAKEQHYLTEERNAVLISTTVMKEKERLDEKGIVAKIERKLAQQMELGQLHIVYVAGKKEDVQEARKRHLSLGKYEVYKKAEANGEKITIEQMKAMKVQQMMEKRMGPWEVKAIKAREDKPAAGEDREHSQKVKDPKKESEKVEMQKTEKQKKSQPGNLGGENKDEGKEQSKNNKALVEKQQNPVKKGEGDEKEKQEKKERQQEKFEKKSEMEKNIKEKTPQGELKRGEADRGKHPEKEERGRGDEKDEEKDPMGERPQREKENGRGEKSKGN